jgi:hypothetical protein
MRALILAALVAAPPAAPTPTPEPVEGEVALSCEALAGHTFEGLHARQETLTFHQGHFVEWNAAELRKGDFACESATTGTLRFPQHEKNALTDTIDIASQLHAKNAGTFLPKGSAIRPAAGTLCSELAGATWDVEESAVGPPTAQKPDARKLAGGFMSDLEESGPAGEKAEPKKTAKLTFAKGSVSWRPTTGAAITLSYRCENGGLRITRSGVPYLMPWTEDGVLWYSNKARPAPAVAP